MVSRASSLPVWGGQSCPVLELYGCIYTFPLSFPFASSFPELLEVLFSVSVWFQNASNSRSCCFHSNSVCFLWSQHQLPLSISPSPWNGNIHSQSSQA